MMRLSKILAFFLGLVFVSGLQPAWAQTALEPKLGPLAGFVELGDDGTWVASDEQGWFMLRNTRDPGAVTYYWAEPRAATQGAYRINLNLALRPLGSDKVFSGVLFNYRSGQNYMGVLLGSDGGTYFVVRDETGFNLQPVDGPPVRGDGTDVIAARVQGGQAQFTLNGARLLAMENAQPFSGQLGIIAVGAGQFGFNEFSVDALQ